MDTPIGNFFSSGLIRGLGISFDGRGFTVSREGDDGNMLACIADSNHLVSCKYGVCKRSALTVVRRTDAHLTPVEPKPLEPLVVWDIISPSAGMNLASAMGQKTSWAMRSPTSIWKGFSPELKRMTLISPR